MNSVKAQKEEDKNIMIYKEKIYLIKMGMELDTKDIEDELELDNYIGQKLIEYKDLIEINTDLIRLTTVCD